MKKILLFITIFFVCPVYADKTTDIDVNNLEHFLSKLYSEMKCEEKIRLSDSNEIELQTCLNSLGYNANKGGKVEFVFRTHLTKNKFFPNFEKMSKQQRTDSFISLVRYLAVLTGLKPVNSDDLFIGRLQSTIINHVYDESSIKQADRTRGFIKGNSIIAVEVKRDGIPQYVACIDASGLAHYSEGERVSHKDMCK